MIIGGERKRRWIYLKNGGGISAGVKTVVAVMAGFPPG